ncbi:MAG: hypothetical protein IPO48_12065 [Saprospiraceae bacterium]|nr:hypothetical protein [Saprospiraceae bacterium]
MAIPLLFLFVTSCNEQNVDETLLENQKVEIRTSDCEDLGQDPTCITIPRTGTYVISGCTVYVSYTLRKCGTSTFTIRDFDYDLANSPACNTIRQQWSTLFNMSSLDANEAMNDFYRNLSIMVEDYEFSLLDPDDFPCPSNNATWSWIETYCHTICNRKHEGDGDQYLNQVICGYSCCIRSTSFCFENGVPKRTDVQINDLSDECDPVMFIACPNGSYNPNVCQKSCARL